MTDNNPNDGGSNNQPNQRRIRTTVDLDTYLMQTPELSDQWDDPTIESVPLASNTSPRPGRMIANHQANAATIPANTTTANAANTENAFRQIASGPSTTLPNPSNRTNASPTPTANSSVRRASARIPSASASPSPSHRSQSSTATPVNPDTRQHPNAASFRFPKIECRNCAAFGFTDCDIAGTDPRPCTNCQVREVGRSCYFPGEEPAGDGSGYNGPGEGGAGGEDDEDEGDGKGKGVGETEGGEGKAVGLQASSKNGEKERRGGVVPGMRPMGYGGVKGQGGVAK